MRADYDRKIAKAVADGKPHVVPVYERRRDGHLVSLCQLSAENAAADQRIAESDAMIRLNRDAKRIADKITINTATPKDIAELQSTHQALKDINTARPDTGTLQLIQLLDGVLAKYKRLQ